jgi:hypothetical protein
MVRDRTARGIHQGATVMRMPCSSVWVAMLFSDEGIDRVFVLHL